MGSGVLGGQIARAIRAKLGILPVVLAGCFLAAATPGGSTARAQEAVATGATEKGQFVEFGGVKIFYHEMGSGDPLYVLHGGPGVPHTYFHPALDSLADAATLVFFDQRGTGRSSAAKKTKDYNLDRMADDLEEMRKKLKHEKIEILGHSFGGMLALTYATKHPDRVDRLVLVSTAASTEAVNQRLAEFRAWLPDSVKRALYRIESGGIFGTDGRYKPEYETLCFGAILPRMWFFDPDRMAALPPLEVSYPVYREMWGNAGEFAITGNLTKYDVTKKLSKIHCPTLILVGKDEVATHAMAEVMRKGILDSQVVVFERSGHYPWLEERERFLKVVRDFLMKPLAVR